MSLRQPDGISWPNDGRISTECAEVHLHRPLSLYVHIPFCKVRCGYCDFNTYTAGYGEGAEPGSYGKSIFREADFACEILGAAGFSNRPASTLFLGGGTPTILPPAELAAIVEGIRERFTFLSGAEVTSEANPESLTEDYVRILAEAGVTRLSIGMQSSVPHVLRTLDRRHKPENVGRAVAWAHKYGLDVSVDLIYGTPGESLADWKQSLTDAIAVHPNHISAYALVIEEGTRMGAQLVQGFIPEPDPDDEATKYEIADSMLSAAGFQWYETSNFARVDEGEKGIVATNLRHASKHNLAYWRDWDWWGFGPGAHSHIGRCRWWNVKHPHAYAQRLSTGVSPSLTGEILDPNSRELERIMLGIRTAEGIPINEGSPPALIEQFIDEGLIEENTARKGRIVLTLRGRLLADYVTRELTD